MQNLDVGPSPAKPPKLTKTGAEAIAIEALSFLAADPSRLQRFLALSGISLENLRVAAAESGFLAAILDHLASERTPAPRLCRKHRARPANDRQGAGYFVAPCGNAVTLGPLAGPC